MPTDSTAEPVRTAQSPTLGIAFAVLVLFSSGCLGSRAIVVDDLLEPLAAPVRWRPKPDDLAAARLASAALNSRSEDEAVGSGKARVSPSVEIALANLAQLELPKADKDLLPLAIDLRNATLDDPIAYRARSRELRSQRALDPRIESRLDRTIDDDPIRLAKRRQFDGWKRLWARTFNAVSQPLGSTLITGFVLAPYQLTISIVHYFADFSNDEPLSLTDRQALQLRRDFLRAHPDTELTPELIKMIDASTSLLDKTLALRRVRSAEAALEANNPAVALHYAEVAKEILGQRPEENRRLRKRAERDATRAAKEVAERSRLRVRSLEARTEPDASIAEAERSLAITLLDPDTSVDEMKARIADYRSRVGKEARGRAEYLFALAQHESGFDVEARERLARLAVWGPIVDPMPRHSAALINDDWQNPFGAFERLRRRANRDDLAWRLAGEWVRRTRYPNLPTPIAYLVDAPTIAMTIILAPLRALISPWTGSPDFRRAPALAGYRYLMRFPGGAEQTIVVDWLYDYESDQKHWGRALVLADLIDNFDPKERSKLVEQTAEERVARVDKIDRRDYRASILQGVANEFPDSREGHDAGMQARSEYENASPQHIRITKSFLLENPGVAGQTGIGLNPTLLNGNDADGELHPEGVLLRGGRVLEIMLTADGGDKKDPPDPQQRRISKQRLAQLGAALEEAVQRNSLIDVGARQAADANRDVYLERAAHGLTEDVDMRPTAESFYVYQSLRERYGLVRGRDSILPFDLVLRGSLADFALGAYPRWRMPPETPDAFLYR